MECNMGTFTTILVLTLVGVAYSFKDQDGLRILSGAVKDTYSIPLLRGNLKKTTLIDNEVSNAFDDEEFNLLHRMKTVEIPPSSDSTDFYASTKHVSSANRFNSRAKRSPQSSGGLKFDGQSNSKPGSESSQGGGSNDHPKSIADKLPRSPSLNFEGGSNKGGDGKGGDDENKRFFPGMFGGGYGPGFGGNHGGYYGGHQPYYPNAGFNQGYPGGGYYGNGGYPGGGGAYGPGFGGNGGGASSASASATSGGVGNGGYGPGGFGGLYGNGAGYYPGNYGGGNYGGGNFGGGNFGGYPGNYYGNGYPTNYPILAGGIPPPGGFAGGFFKDEQGKGGKVSAAVSNNGGKVTSGVSFE